MSNETAPAPSQSYEQRVASQIQQFSSGVHHVNTEMRTAWQKQYVRAKIREVFGVESHIQVYAAELAAACRAHAEAGHAEPYRIASVGCGECSLERSIAVQLVRSGVRNFRLTGLEISPVTAEMGRERIREANLHNVMDVFVCDANGDMPTGFEAVIAHHSLHHIVELERLFDWVAATIGPGGLFLSFDTIGRNGHMLWPEVQYHVDRLWRLLPDRLRIDSLDNQVAPAFRDWDCSTKGFEGIRAQDILPLLVERFHFTKFLGYGGLTDPFMGRRFSGNFHVHEDLDRGVIEMLEQLNNALLLAGYVKPTRMAAVMRLPAPGLPEVNWRGLDARRSVRDTALEVALPVLEAGA